MLQTFYKTKLIETYSYDFDNYKIEEVLEEKLKSNGIYLIVAVKNQEEKIEGVIRSILFRFIYGKEENINNIIITDLGSKDRTPEILEKIGKDYETVDILNWKECKEVIEKLNEK